MYVALAVLPNRIRFRWRCHLAVMSNDFCRDEKCLFQAQELFLSISLYQN